MRRLTAVELPDPPPTRADATPRAANQPAPFAAARAAFRTAAALVAEYCRLRAKGLTPLIAADLALFCVPLPLRAVGAFLAGCAIGVMAYQIAARLA
jgi:hypothetical protein